MPLMKKWRPCLVVVTLDNFMHCFDLPQEVRYESRGGVGVCE